MAAPVCQFVDRVGRGAVQRLNLNDGENLQLLLGPDFPGPDFSPPALKRAVVNTLLAEGAICPASAYDNRVIRLPLRVTPCDEEEMAEIQESLHRELDRANNILKWQPTYNSRPVYFRTFRSPDFRLDQTMEGRGELRVTLALLAEPFAYGDYVEETGTIYNDPAAVANGLFFEIAATEGDVPTPLFLYITSVADFIIIGSRRHGTPALYYAQAEAMIQGVETAIQANDALMSGAGNNYSKTTFALAGWQDRLGWDPVPAAGDSVEYRGTYRVFARVRRTDATSDIEVRTAYGTLPGAPFNGDPVVVPKSTSIQLVDMGLVPIPAAPDPIYDGYTGIVLPAENSALWLQAIRTAGTGNLDWDYAVLVPADEELIIFFGSGASGTIMDGPNDIVYGGDMTRVADQVRGYMIGSIPLVSPNQTNLYVALRGTLTNTKTWTMPYTARYWPRHLYIR